MLKKLSLQQKDEQKGIFPRFLSKNVARNVSAKESSRITEDDQVFLPLNHTKNSYEKKRKRSFRQWVARVFGKKERGKVKLRSVSALSDDKSTFACQKSTEQCLYVNLSAPVSTLRDNYELSAKQTRIICRKAAAKANYFSTPRPWGSSNGAKQEEVKPCRRKASANSRPRYPYDVTRRSSRTTARKRRSSSIARKSSSSQGISSFGTQCSVVLPQDEVFEVPSNIFPCKARRQEFNGRKNKCPQVGSKEHYLSVQRFKLPAKYNAIKSSANSIENHLKNNQTHHTIAIRTRSDGFRNVKRRAERFLSRRGHNRARRKEIQRSISYCGKVRSLITNRLRF